MFESTLESIILGFSNFKLLIISTYSFIELTCKELEIELIWKGAGINIKAIDKKTNKIFIKINKNFFRPAEVNYLRGDFSKAKKKLKWKPSVTLQELIRIMVKFEFDGKIR